MNNSLRDNLTSHDNGTDFLALSRKYSSLFFLGKRTRIFSQIVRIRTCISKKSEFLWNL